MSDKLSYSEFDVMTEDSADIYLYKHKVKTNIIYIVVLIVITICIVLLPVIRIDITVCASGHIRPLAEKTTVVASVTEIVDSVYVKEGDKIRKGDVILTQRSLKNQNQRDFYQGIIKELDAKIVDLEQLITGKTPMHFASSEIQGKYNHHKIKIQQVAADLEQVKREWERNKNLFDLGLLSEMEYNKFYYQYIGKQNEMTTIDKNQQSVWLSDLYNLKKERKEYQSNENALKTDRLLYEICSPVTGNIDCFVGIYKGSNLLAGQKVAVISPDGDLCLDVYVSPRDIAFICRDQEVKIQVDALNYNEWGAIKGKVTDISSDMADDGNGKYYYKIKCALDNDYLTLRNTERKAFLKKGMSATAHFMVTRQSLFTLIYKNIDEWANPAQYKQ